MKASKGATQYHLQVLVEVARQMGKTFELVPLLKTIEQAGRSALGCDRATIFLYDLEAEELYSMVATGTKEIRFSSKLGIAGEAARTKSIILVPDAYADPRFNRQIDQQTGYRTRNMLTLPLIAPDGEVVGVLQVLNKLDGEFKKEDEILADALGSLTGIAIKRQMLLDEAAEKQRLERELNIARDIQQQLLPKQNPELNGFDIAGWNQPADQTGGDCYDFHDLGENRLAAMIADATGHGIGPALIISQCRALFRAVINKGEDLSQVAGTINRLLCEDLPENRFVTICFGVIDPDTCRFNYVSAGHGPLMLFRAKSGKVKQFNATGLPMGILPEDDISLAEPIDLQPGDMFIMLTDGFSEWSRNDGTQYGEDRLIEVIMNNHKLPSADLIQTLYQDVLRFSEKSPQRDDLTAVLIKRTA
ncbi:MAG: SpoIIE family protein phosphatase [Planctomycetota bacterium]|nr:MAG: SpoIIE family protein phosphatase [Planctomycetota bacterium]